jgi:hypothetical protein
MSLRPLGFSQQGPGTKTVDVSLTLTSVGGHAETAAVEADGGQSRKNLSPLGFSQQPKTFQAKSVGDSSVTLPGASAAGQGEHLEGVSVSITLDGAEASTKFGEIPSRKKRGAPIIRFIDEERPQLPEQVPVVLNDRPIDDEQTAFLRKRGTVQSEPEPQSQEIKLRNRFVPQAVTQPEQELKLRSRYVPQQTQSRVVEFKARQRYVPRQVSFDPIDAQVEQRRKRNGYR